MGRGGCTAGSASAGRARRSRRPRRGGDRGGPGARGSTKREDKDSLIVGSRTAVRRLGCRGEDKDSPGFLIFPHSTTPPRRLPRPPRLRRVRRAVSAFSPLVDPQAERATGGRGMVTRWVYVLYARGDDLLSQRLRREVGLREAAADAEQRQAGWRPLPCEQRDLRRQPLDLLECRATFRLRQAPAGTRARPSRQVHRTPRLRPRVHPLRRGGRQDPGACSLSTAHEERPTTPPLPVSLVSSYARSTPNMRSRN